MTEVNVFEVNKIDGYGQFIKAELIEEDVPVNIVAFEEDHIEDIVPGKYKMELCTSSKDYTIAKTHKELKAHLEGFDLAEMAMIPVGTFPVNEDPDFEETSEIIFTGIITDVIKTNDADNDEGDYYIVQVETYGMTLSLFIKSNAPINVGNHVGGLGVLFVLEVEKLKGEE